MYTSENYYTKTRDIDFSTFPEALRKGHEYVGKVTQSGGNWQNYHASATIKKTIDIYFEKLADYISKQIKRATPEKRSKPPKGVSPAVHHANEDIKEYATVTTDGLRELLKMELASQKQQGNTPAIKIRLTAIRKELSKRKERTATTKPKQEKHPADMVERISEEIRFIKRFVNLNSKTKTKEDILRFINSLQKSILEKKIRKTSTYAEQIKFIQQKLIDTFNGMGKQIKIELKEATLEALKTIVGDEQVLSSVNFIKRYINLNGKPGMKQKAKDLLAQINRAYAQGKIRDKDPYIVEMHEVKKNLESYISDKLAKVLDIEPNTLNGLQGVLGCSCTSLSGIGEEPTRSVIMNSMDFANMQFRTLGLKGKWLQLIGDPSTNFTVMVFGKPKMGKSYLCIDFAGYLARNHGKVLYIAREEGLDKTLQDKLNEKDVQHENLFVTSTLPESLNAYDFIFLDSVNKLGLQPEDLNRLKAQYPAKSFIYIFQTTKEGKFRGANTFQHDVDSVIEVPERGKAVQYGRFNHGGEISIF